MFVENMKITCVKALEGVDLPFFPVDDIVSDDENKTEEQVMERMKSFYLPTIAAFVREAVVNNKVYAPNGTVVGSVWQTKCKKNSLPAVNEWLAGQPFNIRSVPYPEIVLYVGECPEGWKKYTDYIFYKTERYGGNKATKYFTQCSARLSPDTLQEQFGAI